MAKAYLGLGANLGNPATQIEDALVRLGAFGGISITARSRMIASKPWGRTDQPDFANMVIGVETALKPLALLDACLQIELEMGRVREEVWGPRLIDIDIITYEDIVIKSARLTLPHPYAHQRDFVSEPLREISPDTADWVLAQAQAS